MLPQCFGLAVLLIRTGSAAELAEWYAGTLGLPIIRGREPTYYLSLGGCMVLELLADSGTPADRSWAQLSPPLLPVIGSVDFDRTVARLERRGEAVELLDSTSHRQCRLRDPDGNAVAIRACRGDDEWDRFRPGVAPLAADLGGLVELIRTARHPTGLAGFYRDVLALPTVDARPTETDHRFWLGRGVELAVIGGGCERALPTERVSSTFAFILRYRDHDGASDELVVRGAPVVAKDLRFNSASLSYFADPEGQVFGVDERYPPERFVEPRRMFAEDAEILRRFAHDHNDNDDESRRLRCKLPN